jgi:RimJ/RimL family protein N-acetyltransferase
MLKSLEKKPFTKTLTGERITLHKAEPVHAEMIWPSVLRDRAQRESSWAWADEIADIAKYFEGCNTELPGEEVVYVIFYQNRAVGTFHSHTMSFGSHRAELGYAIEKTYEGLGLVSEALHLVETELRRLKFNRLEIRCNTDNTRSVQLAHRNQFKLEGTLIQECIEGGRYRDTAIFGKILS